MDKREAFNAYRREWRKRPEVVRRSHDQYLRGRYSISFEQYEQMLAEQGGGCKICGRKDTGTAKQRFFHVDHDPRSGKVRGLLCRGCNTGLGQFGHSPEVLREAIAYIVANEEFADEC